MKDNSGPAFPTNDEAGTKEPQCSFPAYICAEAQRQWDKTTAERDALLRENEELVRLRQCAEKMNADRFVEIEQLKADKREILEELKDRHVWEDVGDGQHARHSKDCWWVTGTRCQDCTLEDWK